MANAGTGLQTLLLQQAMSSGGSAKTDMTDLLLATADGALQMDLRTDWRRK